MRGWSFVFPLMAATLIGASAQDRAPRSTPAKPGVIVEGAEGVTIGGKPAARQGDSTDQGGTLTEGSPNVFINGRPAAVQGGRTECGGVTIGGSANVFINGKPAARAGDSTSGCQKR